MWSTLRMRPLPARGGGKEGRPALGGIRWLALALMLLGLSNSSAGATPQSTERCVYWPFHSLARGAASSRQLALPTRGVHILAFKDEGSFRRFWLRAHMYRDTYQAEGRPPRVPRVDFARFTPIAVLGDTASADVRVQKTWTEPNKKLMVAIFNPRWPDVPMDPERVPYEIILAKRTDRRALPFQRPAAIAYNQAARLALSPLGLPETRARDLSAARLEEIRRILKARGREVLERLGHLPAATYRGPEQPYVDMLRGSLFARFVDHVEEAGKAFRAVLIRWPGTSIARHARARLLRLERRPRDDASRRRLDARREALSAEPEQAGHGRAWLELGQQYEYLGSQEPESLFVAARCYVEAARDTRDSDRMQNALLQAGSLYESYFDPAVARRLYWHCVRTFPDALSVPRVLEKIGRIDWEAGRRNGEAQALRTFLHRFPKCRNAAVVRRMLKSAPP